MARVGKRGHIILRKSFYVLRHVKKIGIQIDFAGAYGRAVLRGVMQFAQFNNDWEFVMPPMYALARKLVDPQHSDGLVAMVHDERSVAAFRRRGVPVVNAARTLSLKRLADAGIHSVVPDDEAVGRMAYRHLRDRGFTRFGFCGHPTSDWSIARQHAFEREARGDGFACSCVARADEVPVRWVTELPKGTAVLAANDRYAWHAVDACRAAGRRVPDDVAILGVDNDQLIVNMVRPALSSMELPGFRIGMEAAKLLASLMGGAKKRARPLLFPPTGIVSRASTDILTIEDEAVGEAVRFIRQNASRRISVDDVVEVVALSRRNLERRFRNRMGRSILEEIRLTHMERAKQLLRETTLEMPAVARESGMSSAVRFSTVFHQAEGMPPTAFRRLHRHH
jgi:LacI family transcriptional regulator